jgi:hypothetical protein
MEISGNAWIGKTLIEAQEYAKNAGFTTRIIELDGKPMTLTCDYKVLWWELVLGDVTLIFCVIRIDLIQVHSS